MQRIVPTDAHLIPDHAELKFQGKLFGVYQWQQELFDGSTATFEMVRRPDTVVVLAVKDGKLVMIREQQPGHPQVVDLPGGRVDPGEEWLDAAKRECAEELGLSFKSWRLVGVQQPVIKMEWFVVVYLATDLEEVFSAQHDAGEKITIEFKDVAEAKKVFAANPSYFAAYLGNLFEGVNTLEDLQALPEFKGKAIERS